MEFVYIILMIKKFPSIGPPLIFSISNTFMISWTQRLRYIIFCKTIFAYAKSSSHRFHDFTHTWFFLPSASISTCVPATPLASPNILCNTKPPHPPYPIRSLIETIIRPLTSVGLARQATFTLAWIWWRAVCRNGSIRGTGYFSATDTSVGSDLEPLQVTVGSLGQPETWSWPVKGGGPSVSTGWLLRSRRPAHIRDPAL